MTINLESVEMKHNHQVNWRRPKLSWSRRALVKTTSPAAKEKNAEGIHWVCHRQKLVKLADSSQLGWKGVQEYESNSLAEDSEDEKKIFKPEARAERKAKATEKSEVKKYSQRVHHYQRQNGETPKPVRPGKCFKCGERWHWKRDWPEEIKP
jgi:hypothetical protein